jgi:hypothetical protein
MKSPRNSRKSVTAGDGSEFECLMEEEDGFWAELEELEGSSVDFGLLVGESRYVAKRS